MIGLDWECCTAFCIWGADRLTSRFQSILVEAGFPVTESKRLLRHLFVSYVDDQEFASYSLDSLVKLVEALDTDEEIPTDFSHPLAVNAVTSLGYCADCMKVKSKTPNIDYATAVANVLMDSKSYEADEKGHAAYQLESMFEIPELKQERDKQLYIIESLKKQGFPTNTSAIFGAYW